MHDSGGRDAQGQDNGRSITARALRRGSGVPESCHCWVFRLHPIPLPLGRQNTPDGTIHPIEVECTLNFRPQWYPRSISAQQ